MVQIVEANGDDLAGPVHGTEEVYAAPVDGVGDGTGFAGEDVAPGGVGNLDGIAAGDAVDYFSIVFKPQPSHLILLLCEFVGKGEVRLCGFAARVGGVGYWISAGDERTLEMSDCAGDAFFKGGVRHLPEQVLQGLFVLGLCEGKGCVLEG